MKTVDFFRTFAACDLKPIEVMKICEYWRSRSILDLAQGHLHLKIKTGFSQKWLGHFEPNFILCLYLAQISGEHFTGPLVLWFEWPLKTGLTVFSFYDELYSCLFWILGCRKQICIKTMVPPAIRGCSWMVIVCWRNIDIEWRRQLDIDGCWSMCIWVNLWAYGIW